MTIQTKKKPSHKIQFGNVDVAIWENTTKEGEVYYTFDLRRSYKDRNEKWQEQRISLGRNDVIKTVAALTKAQMDFYSLPQFQKSDDTPTEQATAA